MKDISVVVPVYNEEQSIESVVEELIEALGAQGWAYEVIIVDDGSVDKTWDRVQGLCKKHKELGAIRFSRNYGQTGALSAGFSRAVGKIIVTMDGDGQNDPRDIVKMIAKMKDGYDLVNGWRRERKDDYFRRVVPSRMANWLISLFTGLWLKDYGCGLKCYQAELVKRIRLYGEMHRMIPALAYWAGARVAEIPVNHRERRGGNSKYDMSRIFSVLFDLLTVKFFMGYFTRPLHFFGSAGLLLFLLSLVAFLVMVVMKVFYYVDMTGNPFLVLGTLLMIIGMQLVGLGLLGEVSIRIYYEVQDKPTYFIKEELGGRDV